MMKITDTKVRKASENNYGHKTVDREWLFAHGFSPIEDVIKRIENQQIHIVNKSGERRTATTKELEQLFPEFQLDMEWYKEHGYCLAEDFFKKMRNKYHYDIQSSEEVICDNETK